METEGVISIRIAVRELVEFLLRSGDLDNRSQRRDSDAMLMGARLHRKLQKQMGAHYLSEVPLSHTSCMSYEGERYALTVEGRADGILLLSSDVVRLSCPNEALHFSEVSVVIDEIKCVLRDISGIEAPVPVHLAQAKCYAFFYLAEHPELTQIGVQLTYCQMESEAIRYFTEFFSREALTDWYQALCLQQCRFSHLERMHGKQRNESLASMPFPFAYRPGQKELAAGVYRTILRKKRLFLEAPTGVGKTMSTLYPAVKGFPEQLADKIFYLTAKTITRTVALEACSILRERGACLLPVVLTAKEKICILEKPDCNPVSCPRARGHYDRINDCLLDMLGCCAADPDFVIIREVLQEFAERHSVCPFELSLDVSLFADIVICDYNYAFDPNVYLKRFFDTSVKNYIFLVDEAHNLVDRAREMYSAELHKGAVLEAKRAVKDRSDAVTLCKRLDALNRQLRLLRNDCPSFTVLAETDALHLSLLRLCQAVDDLSSGRHAPLPDEVLNVYFDARHYIAMYETLDESYRLYGDYTEDNDFTVRLQCMDPGNRLKQCLDKARSAIFFSATLLPVNYYRSQLGGREDDYAVYAPSPFATDHRAVLIGTDISTRYASRTHEQFLKMTEYIRCMLAAKSGNYIVFFPSYQMLSQLLPYLQALPCQLAVQQQTMTEETREEFLRQFVPSPSESLLGLCVMGGIFSEGIDLQEDRLIGAIVLGPGLPSLSPRLGLFQEYFKERGLDGFAYTYQYPGMNKVLQSAGRVIRTVSDRGVILLLDDRFATASYQSLFPREWFPNTPVTLQSVSRELDAFWSLP